MPNMEQTPTATQQWTAWQRYGNAPAILELLLHPRTCFMLYAPIVNLLLALFWLDNAAAPGTAWIYGAGLHAVASVLLYRIYVYFVLLPRALARRWKPWTEEVAVITGGSSGLGLALAQHLASLGAKVAIWDIQPPLEPVNQDRVRYYLCDISDRSTVEKRTIQVERELGPITVLVNNAGIVQAKSILDLTERDIQRTFSVNTLAQFWTVQCILPLFRQRKYGHVVNVASTMGLVGVANMTDYCASKFASVGFHDALRQEIHNWNTPHLVHTTLICPGLILTGMFDGIRIKVPFLIPPLRTVDVVKEIMDALHAGVAVPDAVDNVESTPISSLLATHKLSAQDRFFQHKVIWTPISYYLQVFLALATPLWFSDWVKHVFGGNAAVTNAFTGRSAPIMTAKLAGGKKQ